MANVHYARAGSGRGGLDASVEKGTGVGIRTGWGFGRDFTGFAGVSTSSLKAFGGGSYRVDQIDVGGIYHLFPPRTSIVPYVELAVSRLVIDKARASGITFGAGMQYFLSRSTAIQLGLDMTPISFSGARAHGNPANTGGRGLVSRLLLGVTWHPSNG